MSRGSPSRSEHPQDAACVKEPRDRRTLEARDRAVAAPLPVVWSPAEPGLDRVPSEVPREFEEVPITFDLPGVEATLKEVPVAPMPMVEVLCVTAVQPLHPTREVARRRLEHEVIVVRHQAVAVPDPASHTTQLLEHPEKVSAVLLVEEDGLPSVSAACDVEESSGDLDAKRSGHSSSVDPALELGLSSTGLASKRASFGTCEGSDPGRGRGGRAWACRYTHRGLR